MLGARTRSLSLLRKCKPSFEIIPNKNKSKLVQSILVQDIQTENIKVWTTSKLHFSTSTSIFRNNAETNSSLSALSDDPSNEEQNSSNDLLEATVKDLGDDHWIHPNDLHSEVDMYPEIDLDVLRRTHMEILKVPVGKLLPDDYLEMYGSGEGSTSSYTWEDAERCLESYFQCLAHPDLKPIMVKEMEYLFGRMLHEQEYHVQNSLGNSGIPTPFTPSTTPGLTTKHLNMMLSALRTISIRHFQAPDRAEALLLHTEQGLFINDVPTEHEERLVPNIQSYWLVLEAWSRAGNFYRSEQLLKRMIERHEGPQLSSVECVAPDLRCYNLVLRALTDHKAMGGGRLAERTKRAHAILNSMVRAYVPDYANTEDQKSKFKSTFIPPPPDNVTFNTVLRGYSQIGTLNAANKTREILKDMMNLPKMCTALKDVMPDVYTFNTVLNTAANSCVAGGTSVAIQLTEEILAEMTVYSPLIENRNEVDGVYPNSVKPNCATYNIVLKAHSRICSESYPDAPQRSEDILQRMIDLYQAGDPYMKPDVISYSTVLDCWSRAVDFIPDAPQRAEALLNRLIDLSSQDNQDGLKFSVPNNVCFNSVVKAYAMSNQPESIEKAEALVEKMHQLHNQGINTSARPSAITYTTLLAAYGREGARRRFKDPEGYYIHQKIDQVIDRLNSLSIKFHTALYTAMMDSLIKSQANGFVARILSILTQMEQEYRAGNADIAPNSRTYAAVMHAVAVSGVPDAAERADEILARMQQAYRSGNNQAKPTTWVYNTVIHAYAISRSVDSAKKAMVFLEKMKDMAKNGDESVRPDTVTYNSVITALSSVGSREAAENAERLLREMEKNHDPKRRPTVNTYGAVLLAWANTNSIEGAERAEKILSQMFKDTSAESVRPNTICVNTVLHAWARSGHPQQAERAWKLFKEMENKGEKDRPLRPDSVTINTMLHVCTHPKTLQLDAKDKRQTFFIALSLMKELDQKNVQANQFIYSTFFNVCLKVLDDDENEREQIMRSFFKKCCDLGLVNGKILSLIQKGAPKTFSTICQGTLSQSKLPKEWFRNKINQNNRRTVTPQK